MTTRPDAQALRDQVEFVRVSLGTVREELAELRWLRRSGQHVDPASVTALLRRNRAGRALLRRLERDRLTGRSGRAA